MPAVSPKPPCLRKKAIKIKPSTPALSVKPPTDQPPPRPLEEIDVNLALIDIDNKTDRLDELLDQKRIAELAVTMATAGLMHRIGIINVGGRYRLVYGRRRVLAARALGWAKIPAAVYDTADESRVLEARSIENNQRQELNDAEKAMAVVELLDLEASRIHGDAVPASRTNGYEELAKEDRKNVVAKVAARLGKDEQWVRDYAFLHRLDGKARDLVIKGRLPFSHARLIAQLADPNLRNEFAQEAAADTDGLPMELAELKRRCSLHMFSLAQVPWKLETPFAGCPACIDCPHNSANQPGLFDRGAAFASNIKESHQQGQWARGSGNKEPSAGVCTSHACFAKKSATSNRANSSAAGKAAREIKALPKKDRGKKASAVIAAVAPAYLKPAVLSKQVDEKLKPKKVESTTTRSSYSYENPKVLAERAFHEAQREWAGKLEPKLAVILAKVPGRWAMYYMLRATKSMQATEAQGAKGEKAAQSAGLHNMLGMVLQPNWEGLIQLEKDCGRRFDLIDEWRDGPSGFAAKVAEVFGIDMPTAPKLEDFLPKEKGAKKTKTAKDSDRDSSTPSDDEGAGDGE